MLRTSRASALVALSLTLGFTGCEKGEKAPAAGAAAPAAADKPADKAADKATDGKTDAAKADAANKADAAKTDAAKTDVAKTDAAAAAAPSDAAADSCDKWVSKVCEAAGQEAEACAGARQAKPMLSARACAAAIDDLGDVKAKLAELNKPCIELMDKLCKDLGEDTQTCKMVREKTPSFPTSRCTEMMGQYDKVIDELKKMEAANKPLSPEQMAKLAGGGAPAWGPADAKVTIVEFSDFECPFCSRAADVEKKLKEKYSDRVRFVFRQFPLSFHPNAMPAAIASLEANAQGKFWEVHDGLFANQKSLSRETIEKVCQDAGLDMVALKKALDENKFEDVAKADMKLGEEVGVQGTPSLFVNGERIQNPGDYDGIAAMIDKALAQ
jgi:protein-disulfide isomerase